MICLSIFCQQKRIICWQMKNQTQIMHVLIFYKQVRQFFCMIFVFSVLFCFFNLMGPKEMQCVCVRDWIKQGT
jgi:hypothetical protein